MFYCADSFDRVEAAACHDAAKTAVSSTFDLKNDEISALTSTVAYCDDLAATPTINSITLGNTTYAISGGEEKFNALSKKIADLESQYERIIGDVDKEMKRADSLLKMNCKNGLRTAAKKRLQICDLKTI